MAHVRFELTHDFDAPARVVWDEMIDWKGHEAWIPSTDVEIHTDGDPTAVGAEFTAWSGPAPTTSLGRKLSLEDRMRVESCDYDDAISTGSCKVTKLGPTITGWAGFTVSPINGSADRSQVVWTEDVVVPIAPQFLAPILARMGIAGFKLGMTRLAKLLRNRPTQAVAA